jgi:hypothetical protein
VHAHERGQPRQEIERLEDHVRRAVAIRRFELQANVPALREREPLLGHGRSAHVAAEPFELATRVRLDPNSGMQGGDGRILARCSCGGLLIVVPVGVPCT